MRKLIICSLGMILFAEASRVDAQQIRRIPADEGPWSAAVVVSGAAPLLHSVQLFPTKPDGKMAKAAEQPTVLLLKICSMLDDYGFREHGLIKLNYYVARADVIAEVAKAQALVFKRVKPAVSFVVTALPEPDALVAADFVAMLPVADMPRTQRSTHAAILPSGTRLFISGQAEKGTLEDATRATLESLRKTLQFLKAKDADIVQLKAFVQPMAQVAVVKQEIKKFYGDSAPPVSFVEWKSTLPIEIELIVWGGRERAGEPVDYLTPPGMTTSPVYSRVTRVNYGKLIYTTGFYGKPGAGPRGEIPIIFQNLKKTLDDADSDLQHLAKATYYVTSGDAVKAMGEIRPKYYDPKRPPAASLAVVAGTGKPDTSVTLDMIAVPSPGIAPNEYGPAGFGHGLVEKDARAGWISLFDGATAFGWSNAEFGAGSLCNGTTTMQFGPCELKADVDTPGPLTIGGKEFPLARGVFALPSTPPGRIQLGKGAALRQLHVRPLEMKSLFNGQDLAGWKFINHPKLPAEQQPRWKVGDGLLHVTGGPGALEYQNKHFGDMVLQIEARTRLRYSNGGLFFRSQPGQFMNGYEAQIYHRCHEGDVSKPFTWATGAIDDRQNARRLTSRDDAFFVMTVIARGPHIATWVNGYQTTDWIDSRPKNDNPRQGLRVEPGTIQLQAHDVGTDQVFRRVAAVEW